MQSALRVFNSRSQSGFLTLSAVTHWLGRSDINKTQLQHGRIIVTGTLSVKFLDIEV